MDTTDNRPAYIGLDLIRFCSALAVAIYHLAYFNYLSLPLATPGRQIFQDLHIIAEPARWGWVGVHVFFVLSGFVIAFSAHDKSLAAFCESRILRLYPAAWICGTISLLFILNDPEVMEKYLRSMALWPIGPWMSGVYWTLGVEIVFYLIVAVFVWLKWQLTKLGLIIGSISSVYWIARAVDFATGGVWKTTFGVVESSVWGGISPIMYGCYFGIGILLWSFASQGRTQTRTTAMGIFVLSAVISLCASGKFYVVKQGGASWQAVEPALWWLLALSGIFASVLLNDRCNRLFGPHKTTLRILGLLTYPFYLVHPAVGGFLMTQLSPYTGGRTALFLALICILSLCLLILLAEGRIRLVLRKALAWPRRRGIILTELP